MMHLNKKIKNFTVNLSITFCDVALLEVFSEEEVEGKDGWDMSKEL